MFIVYSLISASIAIWLHLILPKIHEKNWPNFISGLVANGRIGAALAAAYILINPAEIHGVGDVGAAVAIFTIMAGAVRAGWGWLAGKLGLLGADKNHIRGAKIADGQQVARALRGQKSRFSVGEVPIPTELETRGFLLAGSPGTGKSQTLTHALDALRADGQRAVIADASGIYTSRYYDEKRGDVILNPLDARSVAWSPLAEIETVADIPAMCKSLVPDGEGEARTWSSHAQNALDAILEYCFTGGLNNAEIFRLVAVSDNEELREIFAGTPAQPLVAEGNEKMFGSVRGSMTDVLSAIRYLDPVADANSFSIRRHIAEERPGWIFLSYQQQHRDAQKSQIAACVDVASRAVLSLPPSHDRRVVFGLDELPLLGKIQSIIDLATNGRKHGAMIFAGLQTVAQLRGAYGPETSQTFLACLGI